MPPVDELGGMPLSKENNLSNPYISAIVFITLATLVGVAFLVSDMVSGPVMVQRDLNVVTPDPVVEFVNVEVPVYGCPTDYNAIVQTTCVEYGGLVSPINQESLEQIQTNGGICEEQETGIVCQPCLGIEQIGWTCIDNQYLESVEQ